MQDYNPLLRPLDIKTCPVLRPLDLKTGPVLRPLDMKTGPILRPPIFSYKRLIPMV